MSITNVDLVRCGAITAPAAALGDAPRVVQIAEVYPYHRCRYPDREDFDKYLSNEHCPVPFDKILEQILAALELHVSFISSILPSLRSDVSTERVSFGLISFPSL